MNQSKVDNTIAKIRANLDAINNRLNYREQISDLENRMMAITQSEQLKKKNSKNINKRSLLCHFVVVI